MPKNKIYDNLKLCEIGDYKTLGISLGKGNFGDVLLASHKIIGSLVALKIYRTTEETESYVIKNLSREAKILSKLSHPNIVKLYEAFMCNNLYCLSMECVDGGDLGDHIMAQRGKRLQENDGRLLFHQLVSAIDYMHANGILHRDLKVENILMMTKVYLKLADFGLSNFYNPTIVLRTRCGSPEYAAPELFNTETKYGPGVDIWSTGIILYMMLMGKLPFLYPRNESTNAVGRCKLLHQKSSKGLAADHYRAMGHLTKECQDMLSGLIEPNQKARMKIGEVKSHLWLKNIQKQTIPNMNPQGIDTESLRSNVLRRLSILTGISSDDIDQHIKRVKFAKYYAMYHLLRDSILKSPYTQGDCVNRNIGPFMPNCKIETERYPANQSLPFNTIPPDRHIQATCTKVERQVLPPICPAMKSCVHPKDTNTSPTAHETAIDNEKKETTVVSWLEKLKIKKCGSDIYSQCKNVALKSFCKDENVKSNCKEEMQATPLIDKSTSIRTSEKQRHVVTRTVEKTDSNIKHVNTSNDKEQKKERNTSGKQSHTIEYNHVSNNRNSFDSTGRNRKSALPSDVSSNRQIKLCDVPSNKNSCYYYSKNTTTIFKQGHPPVKPMVNSAANSQTPHPITILKRPVQRKVTKIERVEPPVPQIRILKRPSTAERRPKIIQVSPPKNVIQDQRLNTHLGIPRQLDRNTDNSESTASDKSYSRGNLKEQSLKHNNLLRYQINSTNNVHSKGNTQTSNLNQQPTASNSSNIAHNRHNDYRPNVLNTSTISDESASGKSGTGDMPRQKNYYSYKYRSAANNTVQNLRLVTPENDIQNKVVSNRHSYNEGNNSQVCQNMTHSQMKSISQNLVGRYQNDAVCTRNVLSTNNYACSGKTQTHQNQQRVPIRYVQYSDYDVAIHNERRAMTGHQDKAHPVKVPDGHTTLKFSRCIGRGNRGR